MKQTLSLAKEDFEKIIKNFKAVQFLTFPYNNEEFTLIMVRKNGREEQLIRQYLKSNNYISGEK